MTAPLVVLASAECPPALREVARAEAARLGVECVEDVAQAATVAGALALRLDAHGWALIDPATASPRREPVTVRCDLLDGEVGARLRTGAEHESRFASALGIRRYRQPHVLDATAGLGRESVLAAALGCPVVACERSPVVALLLRDGLARAAEAGLRDLVARIDLLEADAREVLASLREDNRPDVVLLDPMFPERKKSAAVKKEMQLLHRLLGSPPPGEDAELLAAALAVARRRVVVKRPAHAPAVEVSEVSDVPGRRARKPDHAVEGRTARYDIYLARPQPHAAEG